MITKKTLLTLGLLLGTSTANAGGLYIGAGYGSNKPDLTVSKKTCAYNDENCYPGYKEFVPGWPDGDVKKEESGIKYEAAAWETGLSEKWDYKTDSAKIYSLSVGWDIPRNPFRFEVEYQRFKFKSPSYTMTIYDSNGYLAQSEHIDSDGSIAEEYTTDVSKYVFDLDTIKPIDITTTSAMLNVYFEIPGFGAVDPYIGYGIGKTKVSWDSYYINDPESTEILSISGGSDGYVSAKQLLAGIEYRITDTPLIIGAEYRDFKVDFDEKDDKIPYNLRNKYFMFKLRYDFISDVF